MDGFWAELYGFWADMDSACGHRGQWHALGSWHHWEVMWPANADSGGLQSRLLVANAVLVAYERVRGQWGMI